MGIEVFHPLNVPAPEEVRDASAIPHFLKHLWWKWNNLPEAAKDSPSDDELQGIIRTSLCKLWEKEKHKKALSAIGVDDPREGNQVIDIADWVADEEVLRSLDASSDALEFEQQSKEGFTKAFPKKYEVVIPFAALLTGNSARCERVATLEKQIPIQG